MLFFYCHSYASLFCIMKWEADVYENVENYDPFWNKKFGLHEFKMSVSPFAFTFLAFGSVMGF